MAYWCMDGACFVIIVICLFHSAQTNDHDINERALNNKLPSLKFSAYVQNDKYQSLMDVQQRNVTDKGMDIVYTAVNWFILKLSKEFRHYCKHKYWFTVIKRVLWALMNCDLSLST